MARLFWAHCLIGLLLLAIYQLTFMARTSAWRDFNHLHLNRVPPVLIERLAVELLNTTYNVDFTTKTVNFNAILNASIGNQQVKVDFPIALFDSNLTVPKNLVKYNPPNLESADGFKAIVVQSEKIPLYGLHKHDIPVLYTSSKLVGDLDIVVGKCELEYGEFVIRGYLHETIVVQSNFPSVSVDELASVFAHLKSKFNWTPLRTIRFINSPYGSKIYDGKVTAVVGVTNMDGIHSSFSAFGLAEKVANEFGIEVFGPSLSFGLFEYLKRGIPCITAGGVHGLKAISLLTAMLSTEPLLPFNLNGYDEFPTTEFAELRAKVNTAFTNTSNQLYEEFPWYQFHRKINALVKRKVFNLGVRTLELNGVYEYGLHDITKRQLSLFDMRALEGELKSKLSLIV